MKKKIFLGLSLLSLFVLASLSSAQTLCIGPNCPGGAAASGTTAVSGGGTGSTTGEGLVDTCTDSVGTDAYACSNATTCPATLAASRPVLFTAGTLNTGAATFAYCGMAAKALVKTVGGISTALVTGDILAKQPVLVRYNATDDDWKMISASSIPSGVGDVTLTGVQTLTNKTLTSPVIDARVTSPAGAGSNTVTAQTQTTGALAGKGYTITADAAVAGSSTVGAAAGGSVTITSGAAARLTSGNADGGNINLAPGAGIGTGATGQVIAPLGTFARPGLAFTGATSVGLYYSGTRPCLVVSGTYFWCMEFSGINGGMMAGVGQSIGFGSTSDPGSAGNDTYFQRRAAGVFKSHSLTSLTTASHDLGTSAVFWRALYLGGTSTTGGLFLDRTITAGGTTGAVTIDKPAGTINVAAAGTSVVVTNNMVTTSSIVMVVMRTNDSTCRFANAVPAAGSFTINLTAACAAETSFGFVVTN